jgi:hypothetical protein
MCTPFSGILVWPEQIEQVEVLGDIPFALVMPRHFQDVSDAVLCTLVFLTFGVAAISFP